jgi:methionyl-tRNA synthetase
MRAVQEFVSRLKENGDIYKGRYEGWYCIPDETFWNEEDLKKKDLPRMWSRSEMGE